MQKYIMNAAALLILAVASASAQGYHWVNPYQDHNGVNYRGHWQSNPDGNPYNNLGRNPGGSYPYSLGH